MELASLTKLTFASGSFKELASVHENGTYSSSTSPGRTKTWRAFEEPTCRSCEKHQLELRYLLVSFKQLPTVSTIYSTFSHLTYTGFSGIITHQFFAGELVLQNFKTESLITKRKYNLIRHAQLIIE